MYSQSLQTSRPRRPNQSPQSSQVSFGCAQDEAQTAGFVVQATAGSAIAPGRPEAPRHQLRHQAPPTAGPGQISSRVGVSECLFRGWLSR